MNIYNILNKKKNAEELTRDEIFYFVDKFTDDTIKDYQASALLMAICINDLTFEETYNLTDAMLHSGDIVDLKGINGVKVDKHSTGGVGDTTTLVVGPLLASVGINFAKLSGRGLGHTGGTLDKLESIKGFNVGLSIDEFIRDINDIGISINGQTANITPADKKIYALRDASATVDNIGLIASSIMSKKLAVDSDVLLLDVKVGSGSFMKTEENAEKLANTMVKIGEKFGRKTAALITNMDEPLGFAVGNSLEVIEAINTLKGEGPKDLTEISIKIGAKLAFLSGKYSSEDLARKELIENITNGKALLKFKEMVSRQGGDASFVDDNSKFKISSIRKEILSKSNGYVERIDALAIGEAAKELGAGRETKEDEIDMGSGVILNKKVEDMVKEGEPLATIYTENKESIDDAMSLIYEAYKIGEKKPDNYKLILKEVDSFV
ncbi:thymidine phosphorylase [Peptoniphilus catoniae]|uniref:thymidine phosphorylase n=1 Tax=Peptoniphilus catoniae TaxID=1660341 RepID=UPI0010FE6F17|nr:thymidine phosphorylase [Peptoniphilus catoniae]